MHPTETPKNDSPVLASLCYFSVFFASFLLPLIVWIVAKESFTKYHAKRALISHLLIFVPTIILIIGFLIAVPLFGSTNDEAYLSLLPISTVIFFVLYFGLMFVIIIWNIIQGIKVLRV